MDAVTVTVFDDVGDSVMVRDSVDESDSEIVLRDGVRARVNVMEGSLSVSSWVSESEGFDSDTDEVSVADSDCDWDAELDIDADADSVMLVEADSVMEVETDRD